MPQCSPQRQRALSHAGTGTTEEFIALAEEISGQQLDDLFDAWLFTSEKPAFSEPSGSSPDALRSAPSGASSWADEVRDRLARIGPY